jgi:hypothetical protein
MSSIREGRPFANTYKACRGSAGGMTLSKAYTEGVDNSFDAGSSVHYTGLVSVDDTQVFFELNDAPGLLKMPHLYGLAKDAPVKTEKSDTGMFNSGHTAETGFFDPKQAYSESAVGGAMYNLKFEAAGFVNAYEANADDMAKTDVNEYMSCGRERGMETNELLVKICEKITHPEVKLLFASVVARTQPDYMLHLYVLRKKDSLSPEDFRGFMPSLAMSYKEVLETGATIIHIVGDNPEKPEENVLVYTEENVVDVLYDTEQFPVLCFNAELKKHALHGLSARVTIFNEATPTRQRIMYVCPSNDGRRKGKPEPRTTPPPYWAEATPYINLNYRMNVLTEEAADEQLEALGGGKKGSEIKGVDYMRGIMLKWAYRLIGTPYWKKGGKDNWGFGDARNKKFPRCVLEAEGCDANTRQARMDVVAALKIQSNKHNNNMDSCEDMISFLHAMAYGTLTHSYTDYKNGISKNGRTTPWDLEEFEQQIMRQWVPGAAAAAPAPPAPAPPPAPPAPIPPPRPNTDVSFTNDLEQKDINVLHQGRHIASIHYYGQYHIERDSLMQRLMHMGDQRFVDYAVAREQLETEFEE